MDWKLLNLLLIIFGCSIFISSSAQSTDETSTAIVTNENASSSAITTSSLYGLDTTKSLFALDSTTQSESSSSATESGNEGSLSVDGNARTKTTVFIASTIPYETSFVTESAFNQSNNATTIGFSPNPTPSASSFNKGSGSASISSSPSTSSTSTATPYENSASTYTVQVDNNCILNKQGKDCFEIITKSRTFVLYMQGKNYNSCRSNHSHLILRH